MSLRNILGALAPIAAGAMFGPGGAALAGSATAGTAGTAIAAGALTGAGIAAIGGDDPLMGAVSGGLGGYSGGQLSGAASAGLAPTTTTTLPTGMVDQGLSPALQNSTFSGVNANSIGTQFTPTAGVNKGISMANVTMPNTGKALGTFGDPSGSYLNRLGGGSTLMGAGKLGAIGLPVIGAAAMPDYNQTEDPMSKYDPKRRLNLGMTTGIQNAMNRDSGLRLNQGFAQGGYTSDRRPEDYTAEEIEYMFGDPNSSEALERATLDREHRRRLENYVDIYDRSPRGELESILEEIKSIPQRIRDFQEGGLADLQRGFSTPPRAMPPRAMPPQAMPPQAMPPQTEGNTYQLIKEGENFNEYLVQAPNGAVKKIIKPNKDFSKGELRQILGREDKTSQADIIGGKGMAQGGYLETGMGDGMSDDIESSIDGEQPAALSENEFVIPADVVSGLGNGSSDAGAEQLYAMMDRVRKARTGNEKQGREIMPQEYMPA